MNKLENMSNSEIDYLGLRRQYEKTGNQEKLDNIILIAFKKLQGPKRQELLKGINVSPSLAKRLNISQLTVLLLAGAGPKELLVEIVKSAKNVYNFQDYDKLYRSGFIDVAFFEKYILEAKSNNKPASNEVPTDINNICNLFEKEDLEVYVGLDFRKIEDKLLSYLSECSKEIKHDNTIFKSYCDMLRKLPYDETRNAIIAKHINDNCNYSTINTETLISTLTSILKDKTAREIIDMLYRRPDLVSIFSHGDVFRETLVLNTNMEELLNLVCEGNVGPIGLLFHLYSWLYFKRIAILNYWIANGLELLIDVYMDAITNNRLDEDYASLDRKHIEAMQGEKDKPFAMQPIEE